MDSLTFDAIQRLTGPEIGQGVLLLGFEPVIKIGSREYVRTGQTLDARLYPTVPKAMKTAGEHWSMDANFVGGPGRGYASIATNIETGEAVAVCGTLTGGAAEIGHRPPMDLTSPMASPGVWQTDFAVGPARQNCVVGNRGGTFIVGSPRGVPSKRLTDLGSTIANTNFVGTADTPINFVEGSVIGGWVAGFDLNTSQCMQYSLDDGVTWQSSGLVLPANYRPLHAVFCDYRDGPPGEGYWFMIAGDGTRTSVNKQYYSTDFGATWTYAYDFPHHGYVLSLKNDGAATYAAFCTSDASNAGVWSLDLIDNDDGATITPYVADVALAANQFGWAAYPTKQGFLILVSNKNDNSSYIATDTEDTLRSLDNFPTIVTGAAGSYKPYDLAHRLGIGPNYVELVSNSIAGDSGWVSLETLGTKLRSYQNGMNFYIRVR